MPCVCVLQERPSDGERYQPRDTHKELLDLKRKIEASQHDPATVL